MLQIKWWFFGNIVGYVKGVGDILLLMSWIVEQFDLQFDWIKIVCICDLWGGKLILKGINDFEDVCIVVDFGVDVIVVSNYGGRQLDGVVSLIWMLFDIVEVVGDWIEVYLDSGICLGQDVLKVLVMGVYVIYIGCVFIYGFGVMGEVGVIKVLEVICKELDIIMVLCGECDVKNLGCYNLMILKDFFEFYL